MSIYIKMDMPETGLYLLSVDNNGTDKVIFTVADQTHSGKIIPKYVGEAITVPSHGRLKDIDALEERGADVHQDIECCGFVEDTVWGFSYEMLEEAETIIPADPAEEGDA